MIARISALLERQNIALENAHELKLRKANRIKTIHSSLAIEGNTLSVDEVTDIVNGKQIIAPPRQIQEVRNAIRVYDLYSHLDPFAEMDLLKAHGIMMEALADDGKFVRGPRGTNWEEYTTDCTYTKTSGTSVTIGIPGTGVTVSETQTATWTEYNKKVCGYGAGTCLASAGC